jgi:hypothetical protein
MSIEEGQEAETGNEEATPEVVKQARDMGWVPETEWKGAPPKNGFLDPAEYVRRGEKIMPIINARARKAEEKADRLERELQAQRDEHRDTVRRIERMTTVALEQQRAQIEAKYSDRIDHAAATGDTDAVRQARKEEKEALAALDKRLEEPEEEKKARAANAEHANLPPAVKEWLDANPWYEQDEELNGLATAIHKKLLKEKPGMSLADNLAEVRKRVAKRYPEQFEAAVEAAEDDDEPKRRGSPVEGGSRVQGGAARSGFSRLPAEAKAACDRFIKDNGLFLQKGETVEKDMAKARERYAAEYFGDQK